MARGFVGWNINDKTDETLAILKLKEENADANIFNCIYGCSCGEHYFCIYKKRKKRNNIDDSLTPTILGFSFIGASINIQDFSRDDLIKLTAIYIIAYFVYWVVIKIIVGNKNWLKCNKVFLGNMILW